MHQLYSLFDFGSFMYLIWLIIGFLILVKGADLLVDSASNLAEALGVSTFIIGLSVVAFGTSAPESAVGFFSAIQKANQLSLGNVVGSCIANIALIIGLTATIHPLEVNREIVRKEIPMSFLVELLLCILVFTGGILGRIDGIILIVVFGFFLYYILINSRPKNQIAVEIDECCKTGKEVAAAFNLKKNKNGIIKPLFTLLAGLTSLVLGGNMVVDNASAIARLYKVNETIIGLTIVTIGTTLPEMVATLTATLKGKSDIAVGNILGSNIFNILFVLGLSATINPISSLKLVGTPDAFVFDMLIMLLFTAALFIITSLRYKVPRWAGILFIFCYLSYIAFKVIIVV